ncbi:MAG: TonB-dependent receptor [Woeseiaceae bacterium]|nr:TonB-dependent receptor [Woeseiaceae bacterium]
MRSQVSKWFVGSATTSSLIAGLVATSALLYSEASLAQLEEIVVTASRRTETDLQVTPVSITAVGQEDFEKLFAQDVGEIAQFVPNFSAATVTGFNAASFGMRGAAETDIIVYFDPKVGVLVDDFVVPHVQTQLLEPFDIEAIEVLRGPQGTLFGKNTTGGAVVVRTIRPQTESNAFEAAVSYGSFSDVKVRATANIPFSDTVAFRFAGLYQQSDGYYSNGKVDNPVDAFGTGVPVDGSAVAGDGSDLGGKDILSTRFKLLWEPNERFRLLGQYEYIDDSSDPLPVINDTPDAAGQLATLFGFPGVSSGDPLDQAGIHRSSIVNLDGSQSIEVNGLYLNGEYDFEKHTLFFNLGQRNQESRLPNEYLGTPYESFFAATRDDDRETFQFEARLASQLDGNINYVVGLFHQTNDAEFCVLQQLGLTEFFGSAVPNVLDNSNPLLICNRQDATATAIFADATINITDQFTLGIGGRFTDEEKDFIAREGTPTQVLFPGGQFNEPLDGQDFANLPGRVETDSESWEEPTYRIMGSYQFNDDVFSYLSYTRGFKSGGYNDQAGSGGFDNFPLAAYDPEFANSWELGLKTTLNDGRMRFNATLFHVNYEDFQRSTVVSLPNSFQETRTFNAADVDASGIELEFAAAVTDNFTINAHLGTIDAEYNEFLLDRNADGILEDFSGRDVVRSPDLNWGVDLQYNQDLGSNGSIRWNANYKFEDENVYYYNDDIGEEFDTILEERNIVNASVTWTNAANTWHVAAFGKNLTDERYKTASQAVGVLWTFSNYGPPRAYGIEAGFRFGQE